MVPTLFSELYIFIDTKLKQQRLPAWQPILTAGTVLPAFFAIGIAFIPLGAVLLVTSNDVSFFKCFKVERYTCVSLPYSQKETTEGF